MNEQELTRFNGPGKRLRSRVSGIKPSRKRSHWMWYIFPQIVGLGFSATSRLYAIKDRSEAVAYLQHPVLGSRLIENPGVAATG